VPEALVAARVMAPAIAETRSVTLASIILLDSNGTILSGAWQGQSLAEVPEVAEALGGIASTRLRRNASYKARTMLEVFSRAATIRLHHARPVLVSGRVVGVVLASRSPRALMRGLYEDRGKIALGTGLIFVVLTGLSLILARTIVRPIEALSAASRALASGTRATPQRSALNVVEIATLFDDFEAMSASIERRSAYLRDFAAAVSHEFKTPIAALHGTIEILDDHGPVMDDTQRRQFLDNMRQDTGRLSRLVSRLLDLARADMQAVDRDVRCDVADACRSVATQCSTRAMAVSCQLPDGPVLARIDQGVLEAVLVTLADNAAQAGADRFQLTLTADAGQVLILATNSGPAIPEADRERIFEPFFTSRRAEGGTGMGLAIARSLLGGYHATLTLEQPDRPPAGRVADMPVAFLLSLAAVQSD
nr:HAMP domain-containing histidine kinase [Hyphomonadaceae bacterium]